MKAKWTRVGTYSSDIDSIHCGSDLWVLNEKVKVCRLATLKLNCTSFFPPSFCRHFRPAWMCVRVWVDGWVREHVCVRVCVCVCDDKATNSAAWHTYTHTGPYEKCHKATINLGPAYWCYSWGFCHQIFRAGWVCRCYTLRLWGQGRGGGGGGGGGGDWTGESPSFSISHTHTTHTHTHTHTHTLTHSRWTKLYTPTPTHIEAGDEARQKQDPSQYHVRRRLDRVTRGSPVSSSIDENQKWMNDALGKRCCAFSIAPLSLHSWSLGLTFLTHVWELFFAGFLKTHFKPDKSLDKNLKLSK